MIGSSDQPDQSPSGDGGSPLLLRNLRAGELRDSVRREVNVAKAIAVAEQQLAQDDPEIPDSSVDSDWLHRWREAAAGTSKETLQFVWGQLLAGQIKQPGRYPLRLVDFVRSLDEIDAQLIEKLLRLAIGDYIFNESEKLDDYGLSLVTLMHLETLGIVAGVSTLGLKRTWTVAAGNRTAHIFGKRVVVVTAGEKDVACSVPIIQVTSLGCQLYTLGTFAAPENYILSFAKALKKLGFLTVEIGDVAHVTTDGKVAARNKVEIDAQTPASSIDTPAPPPAD